MEPCCSSQIRSPPPWTISPSPKRNRSSWFLSITKCGGSSELILNYKNTKGGIAPYSTSKPQKNVREAFGTPVECAYVVNKKSGEVFEEFVFTSRRRESARLRIDSLNSFDAGVNSFTKKIASMVVQKQVNLLSLYITLLTRSVGYANHREGLHTDLGLNIDGEASTIEIAEKGGTMEDYEHFVKVANESAKVVEPEAGDTIPGQMMISSFLVRKRKNIDQNQPRPKKSKAATIDYNQGKELRDHDGLEKEYYNSIMGMTNIPLDNLLIPKELQDKVNPFTVYKVKNSMGMWYDPSQSIPVVCPSDAQGGKVDVNLRDGSFVQQHKFEVVQKIHTVSAFKKLDETGEFSKLPSHENRTVLCFVLQTSSSGLIHYGNIRANEIQRQFVRDRTCPQDMLRVYHSLGEKLSPEDALKVVERMARLSRIGPNEITALRKLCSWSPNSFAALMEIISKFELYQTMDVKPKGHQNRMAEGLKLNMTDLMFKLLAKVDEVFFMKFHQKILSSECSLRFCIDEHEKAKQIEKVEDVLSVIAGHSPYETIARSHPGKFDRDHLKPFVGAEIKKGEKNKEAKSLEKYYVSVIEGSDFVPQKKMEQIHDVALLFKQNKQFENIDTVVFYITADSNRNVCFDFMKNSIESKSEARLIIFPDEEQHFEALSFLKNESIHQPENFRVVTILFSKTGASANVSEGILEDVQYAVLFGFFSVSHSPITVYNKSIHSLSNIVEKITPPKSTVALIADQKSPLVQVHSVSLVANVTYYGVKNEVLKFKNELHKKFPSEEFAFLFQGTDSIISQSAHESTSDEEKDVSDVNNNSSEHTEDHAGVEDGDDPYAFETPKSKAIFKGGFSEQKCMMLKPNFLDKLNDISEEIDDNESVNTKDLCDILM